MFSSKSSFTGSFAKPAKVNLSGKSSQAESREAVLERVRFEREKRQKERLENKSATTIQAAWRSYQSRKQSKSYIKAQFIATFLPQGIPQTTDVTSWPPPSSPASIDNLIFSVDSPFLHQLVYFIDHFKNSLEDACLLAWACGYITLALRPSKSPQTSAAARSFAEEDCFAGAILLRLQKMVYITLKVLTTQYLNGNTTNSPSMFVNLRDVLVSLTDSAHWESLLSSSQNHLNTTSLTEKVVYAIFEALLWQDEYRSRPRGLFESLAALLSSPSGHEYFEDFADCLLDRYIQRTERLGVDYDEQQMEKKGTKRASSHPASLFTVVSLPGKSSQMDTSVESINTKMPKLLHIALLMSRNREGEIRWWPVVTSVVDLQKGQQQSLTNTSASSSQALTILNNIVEYSTVPGVIQKETIEAFLVMVTTLLKLAPLDPGHSFEQLLQHSLFNAQPTLLDTLVQAALAENCRTNNRNNSAVHVCAFISQLMNIPGYRARILVQLSLKCNFLSSLWYGYLQYCSSGVVTQSAAALDAICLFSEVFTVGLQIMGDEGLYNKQQFIPLSELYSHERPKAGVIAMLRAALWQVLWIESSPVLSTGGGGGLFGMRSSSPVPQLPPEVKSRVVRSVGKIYAQLHERNGRRPFAPSEAFYAENLPPERFQSEIASAVAASGGEMPVPMEGIEATGISGDSDDDDDTISSLGTPQQQRAFRILSIPALVPFTERAKVFQQLVSTARSQYRSSSDAFFVDPFTGEPTRHFIEVHRNHMLEDAYRHLGNAPVEQLRGRVRVTFMNETGMVEAGVDGGGLFKEFLEGVLKEGFSPETGLFKATIDNRLYPNPHSTLLIPDALHILEFLGKMVGKALLEGILVELPLAPFFLKKLRGVPCDVDDLYTLDPQLARNLNSLKTSTVADLGLTFSVTDEFTKKEIPLMPDGQNTPVTSQNAALYVHRLADYRLNKQLQGVTAALSRGLYALVPRPWLSMFNDKELQELIAGKEEMGLNVDDLARNCQLSGGYSQEHPAIRALWMVLKSFSPKQQADFLRFVTSCPRAPLLGFKYLEPVITIQKVGGSEEEERLPTVATCMNLLKLPSYRNEEKLKEKLLYAIESGAGFELS